MLRIYVNKCSPFYEGKLFNNRNFILKCMEKVCTMKNLISGHNMAP
jgi:hypothetical protein